MPEIKNAEEWEQLATAAADELATVKAQLAELTEQHALTRQALDQCNQQHEEMQLLECDDVAEAHSFLERILNAADPERLGPYVHWRTIEIEMRRLRIAIVMARQLFESLDKPVCVGCGQNPNLHANDCGIWAWWHEHYEIAAFHRLVLPNNSEGVQA